MVSAVLELTQSGYSSWDYSYPVTINAHRITSELSFPNMTWNTLNGNYEDRVLDSQSMDYSRIGDMHAWNLTGTVRDWYRNGENYGIALVSTCEEDSVYRYATLYSAKRVGLSTSLLPRATIVYLNQEGLSDDLTYHSAGTAGTGVLSICDFTGGLSYVFTDISMSGAHLPVTIQHIHNNDRRAEDQLIPGMRFGKGFRLNLNQSIQSSSVSGYPYSYTDADGTELYFVLKSGTAGANGSTYYQETEPTRILTKTSSGFTLDLGDSIVYSFNKALGGAYYLSSIHNGKNNKTQTLGYDAGNRLTSVTDGGGRVTTLTYNSSGYLTRITDPDSRVTAYDYDTEGHLVSIERWYAVTYSAANAERTTIEYGSEVEGIIDGIETVEDAYGRHLTVFCGGRTSRAFFITEYSSDGTGGGTLNFTYSAGETTVTDAEGHSETLLFDDYGHTVAIRDGEGNGIFGNYGTGNAETRNKLTVESKLQSSVANYLTNAGAEGSSVSPWTLEQNGGNGSLSQTTAEKYGGSKAYSLTSSSTSGELESYQIANISGGRGKSITFSGYLKTGSLNIGNEPEAGLYLALDVINQDGIWERSYSPVITEASYASDWTRVAVTATIPEDTVSEQVKASLLFSYASGTVYADELQLEMGGAANRCNLLENGHLAGIVGSGTASGWTGNQLNANTDKLTAGRRYHAQNNAADTGFTVTGDVSKAKYLTQTVQQSGSAGDCYVFTAWAKADAIPQTDGGYNPIYSRNRPFGVLLRFIKADGSAEEKSFSFDAKTENWQLLSGEAMAPCAYVRLEIRLLYSYQAGTACFDDIGLYRDGFGETMTYDSKGRLSLVRDSAGRTVSYSYASPDRSELSSISYPDETNVWYYYDSSWRLIREEDSSGHITYYSYDADGNLRNTNMSNDGLTLSSGNSSFDRNGYLTEQVPTVGSTVTYSYNNRGTLLSMADSVSTLYYDHDDKDRLTQVRGPARVQYSYTGDQLSHITHYTTGQTSGPVTYRLNHDGLGNVTDISVGHNLLVSYTYDEYSDKLLETYYGNGFSVTPEYDSLGRVISQSSEGIPYVRWAYGADGRIGTETDCASGVQTRYAYNKDGSLASVTRDNGTRFTYGYDFTKGKLTEEKIRVGSEEKTVSYDYYGLNAGYDSSLLKKIVLPQVNVNGSNVTPELHYSYDIIGRSYPVLTLGSTELIDVSCTYCNVGGELTTTIPESIRIETPEGVETLLYDYDDRNNITRIRRQTAQGTTLLVSYTYDELNQLVREDNAELDLTYIYKYDFGGNITRARQYAYTTESVEDISSVTWDLYEYYGAWGDVLDYFCDVIITYDAIGNPLDYVRDLSFSWERGRLLGSVDSRSDGDPIACYTYNPSGIRTSKTVYVNGVPQTTTYTLDGDTVVREECGSDVIWYYYDAAGALLGFELNGEPYYYIKNVQGDIIRIIDKTGYTVVSYTYDAWGNLRATSGSLASTVGVKNPYRYRGYRYDAETGLYYVSSRYYDPEVRRFISPDTTDVLTATPGALTDKNLYVYCDNNPVMRADQGGDFWHIVIGAAVGGVIGAISSIVGQVVSGNDINWGEVAVSAGAGALSGAINAACPGMGAVATGLVQGAIGAGTYAATELVNGRTPTIGGTLTAGITSGVLAGGAKAISNQLSTTKLYRSVSSAEANSFSNTGTLSAGPGQMEGKFFATTEADARIWGSKLGNESLITIRVPKSALSHNSVTHFQRLDGIGSAYYFSDLSFLNSVLR